MVVMKLSQTYTPKEFEKDIYALWEASKAFEPQGKGDPFTIVMPPPNANAGLHIGHVLGTSQEDITARYMRMRGKRVEWIPGADHAGFETQVVYEKQLAKEGKSRFDFSREELYDQVFEFVAGNRNRFNDIFRQLGASVNWNNFHFTLDQSTVDVAYSTFEKLWKDGLIYRGERLVNYCTEHRTGFADIEVEYKEQNTPLYYMKYGPFELATTRPETKFGDTAVAVHPDDERYQKYIGQTIEVEGINGPFEIVVVADEMVDKDFGTGVVKITPAHDFNDWEVAQRHNLSAKRVINHDGTMNHEAGQFEGMTVTEARKAVVEALKKKKLLVRVDEKYQNRVGKCYKCGTQIEPMLLDQWFVDMQKLAQPAIKALKNKEIEFFPEAKRDQTIEYLENVRDWNISRQIAWGIPIPAFQNVDDEDEWVYDTRVDQHTIEKDGKTYRRDPDVFDTWFSSGQWPYVTTGYPDDSFKDHYPTQYLEMGIDILYQWAARMICLSLYVTGKIPFEQLYLHGMVRATDGTKMSKSKGNVIDPYPLIDEYGTDALRLGMISGRSAGESAAYDPSKVVAGRNFCNKLWNIARYIESIIGDDPIKPDPKTESVTDNWVLRELQQASESIEKSMDDYRFSEAYDTLYHVVWDSVADWYIEASKYEKNKQMMAYVLDTILRLAHPFAPFVTETIWQTLGWTGDSLLISQQWPKVKTGKASDAEAFSDIQKIVAEIRVIKSELKIKKTSLFFASSKTLDEYGDLVKTLAGLENVAKVEDGNGLNLTQTDHKAWLDIDRETREHYAKQLEKQREELEKRFTGLKKRLGNENYVSQAPKELVNETKHQLKEAEEAISRIDSEIKRFS